MASSPFQAQPLHHPSAQLPQSGLRPSPAQPHPQPPPRSAGHPSPRTQWVPSTSWDPTCLQPQPQPPAPGGPQPPICTCPQSSSVNLERCGGSSGRPPSRACWWRDPAPRGLEVSTEALVTSSVAGLGGWPLLVWLGKRQRTCLPLSIDAFTCPFPLPVCQGIHARHLQLCPQSPAELPGHSSSLVFPAPFPDPSCSAEH